MQIEYLCFRADRISFVPTKDQVIFFTPRNRYYRMGLSLIRYVDENYALIEAQFKRKGLEFVFLPRTTRELNITELYKYFRPDASENEILHYQKGFIPEDMLNYLIESCPDSYNMPFGLLRYTGFKNNIGYIFNYTPIFCEEQWFAPQYRNQLEMNLYNQLEYYLHYNAGSTYSERQVVECPKSRGLVSRSCVRESAMPESADFLPDEDSWDSMPMKGSKAEFQPTQKLSRLLIRNNRIFLPDYNNLEIKMTPMAKAVYFLFLRHPEGIVFKYLPDYRDELRKIYASVSRYDDKDHMERSIMDVTDPMKNTINENTSRIRRAFVEQFDESLARNYFITGERGEAKKVALPRHLVVWEQHLLG